MCDDIWYFEENEDGEKTVKSFDGDFDDYKKRGIVVLWCFVVGFVVFCWAPLLVFCCCVVS